MYLSIMNQTELILYHKNVQTNSYEFLDSINRFVPGHALYMKMIISGKTNYDNNNSQKITALLRRSMIPTAYVYPAGMRVTRDLLRRRQYLLQRNTYSKSIKN